jgi:hypothetical protein
MREQLQPPRAIPKGLIRRRALFWLAMPFFFSAVFSLGMIKELSTKGHVNWRLHITMFLLVFTACAFGCVWDILRSIRLIRYGVEVTGKVIKQSRAMWGKCVVTIEYEFESQRFRHRFSHDPRLYPVDSEVVVVVDPKYPKRFEDKRHLLLPY